MSLTNRRGLQRQAEPVCGVGGGRGIGSGLDLRAIVAAHIAAAALGAVPRPRS